MVIGLGTGSTAGWMAAIPSVERVDVAELEPAILHVAEACAAVNRDVMKNPKVRHFLGDARELLDTTRERYDLVFSEPSNPYRAGISSLFTQDFYRAMVPRLQPGGLFLQWVQAYSVDAQTVRTVFATLQSVFPYVETWVTEEADLLLVASLEPMKYDIEALKKRMAEEPYRAALASIWRVTDVEGLFAHHAAAAPLAQSIAAAEGDELSTDDLTLVEFGFARNAGRRDALFNTNELRSLSRARGDDRPAVTGTIDWARVEERRLSMLAAQEIAPTSLPYRYSPNAQARQRAFAAWLAGDFKGALVHFQKQPEPPADSMEQAVVAESLADAGDETARPLAEALRKVSAIEADVILARLALRQNKPAEATELLERAFVAYRKDPWPLPLLMTHATRLPV
jgi:hypothetical protein